MNAGIRIWVLLTLLVTSVQAQEAYFAIKFSKGSPAYYENLSKGRILLMGAPNASIAPVSASDQADNYTLKLDFKGKSKQQLIDAVLAYVDSHPEYVLKTPGQGFKAGICYRDFSVIGGEEKYGADLIALTLVHVYPGEGNLQIAIIGDSNIYSTIFKAKLRITADDRVASDDDLPFNTIKYVQPPTRLTGKRSGVKEGYGLAYPESVFDGEGNIINQASKDVIEQYYNALVKDLKAFIDKKQ